MRRPDKASEALAHAEAETAELKRSIWLAKAADYAIDSHAILVGGTAVNLHTNRYKPTDVDMCAYLDEKDRQALKDLGFGHTHGDHFRYTFGDGQIMLLEFPATWVDGEVMTVVLDGGETLSVITRESLVVDRIEQATDRSKTQFEEALRLCIGVADTADWSKIDAEIKRRDLASPLINLAQTYDRVLSEARSRREQASST